MNGVMKVSIFAYCIAMSLGQVQPPTGDDAFERYVTSISKSSNSTDALRRGLKMVNPIRNQAPPPKPQDCKNSSIVLVVDVSGSLRNHRENLKNLTKIFFDTFSSLAQNSQPGTGELSLAVVAFNDTAKLVCDFNCNNDLPAARQGVNDEIAKIYSGTTNTKAGLKMAHDMLKSVTTHKSVILISDGGPNPPADDDIAQAKVLRDNGTVVHSIFLNVYGASSNAWKIAKEIMDQIAYDNTTSHVATDFATVELAKKKLDLVFKRICDDASDPNEDTKVDDEDCDCKVVVAVAVVPVPKDSLSISLDLKQGSFNVKLNQPSKPKEEATQPATAPSPQPTGQPAYATTPPPTGPIR